MEVDKYEVLEKIGHGSFGVIRKVKRKSDGYVLCRKEINYLQMSPKEREQLQSELSVLKNLRHPNIVAYYEREHLKASQDLHIYMEYCEEGDLGKRIKDMKRNNQMAEEDFVWSVFTQLVTGLYRCHYGEDAPEVGKNAIGLGSDAKPVKGKPSHAMILHRDLKPENIFLGSDASVKLGDFGLSKIMQSHDFASTYVGTPFYMSPEICAAEQYSLHSDIWAFGCIMYELCAKEPPFNAKTHLELIQKIRLGRVRALPSIYSPQLQEAISHCLKVNPQSRPDTVHLLNLPMVKLKRKELEVVRLSRQLRAKEELAARTLKEAERKAAAMEEEKVALREQIDDSLRREWEVKARLEIDRQVQQGLDRLYQDFEIEVGRRVQEELRKHQISASAGQASVNLEETQAGHQILSYHQSQSTTGETDDFPSSTDLSDLSLESPVLEKRRPQMKSTRTPFSRAQTMFEGSSPADVQMVDPSPAPIASLGLSPRRQERLPSALSRNIFSRAAVHGSTGDPSAGSGLDDLHEEFEAGDESEDDTDEVPALPSPTRLKTISGDPFKEHQARRPPLPRQRTAPQKPATAQPVSLFKQALSSSKENQPPPKATTTSPTRARTSKLPAATATESGSPLRKAPPPPTSPSRKAAHLGLAPNATISSRSPSRDLSQKRSYETIGDQDMRHTAMLNSRVQGRTLVELAQARGISQQQQQSQEWLEGSASKSEASVTVWDPERDEMPSPFLKRGVGNGAGFQSMAGAIGGPGFRHLR